MTDDKLPDWTAIAAFPGMYVTFGAALAGGAYMGFNAGIGMPIPHEGRYLIGAPIAGGALTAISPFSLWGLFGRDHKECVEIGKGLFGIGALSSVALLPIGYGLGYAAGKLTQ